MTFKCSSKLTRLLLHTWLKWVWWLIRQILPPLQCSVPSHLLLSTLGNWVKFLRITTAATVIIWPSAFRNGMPTLSTLMMWMFRIFLLVLMWATSMQPPSKPPRQLSSGPQVTVRRNGLICMVRPVQWIPLWTIHYTAMRIPWPWAVLFRIRFTQFTCKLIVVLPTKVLGWITVSARVVLQWHNCLILRILTVMPVQLTLLSMCFPTAGAESITDPAILVSRPCILPVLTAVPTAWDSMSITPPIILTNMLFCRRLTPWCCQSTRCRWHWLWLPVPPAIHLLLRWASCLILQTFLLSFLCRHLAHQLPLTLTKVFISTASAVVDNISHWKWVCRPAATTMAISMILFCLSFLNAHLFLSLPFQMLPEPLLW